MTNKSASDFFKDATDEEKKEVYERVAKRAIDMQKYETSEKQRADKALTAITPLLCILSLKGDEKQKALANDLAKLINRYNNDDCIEYPIYEPVMWMYEHESGRGEPMLAFSRWKKCEFPFVETTLYKVVSK